METFPATVDSILVYCCEAWALATAQEAKLDVCYTCMLRMVLNVSHVSQQDRMRNIILYGKLPRPR
jgi:hypothetical protein